MKRATSFARALPLMCACLALFSLPSCVPVDPADRQAWEALAEISQTSAAGALPGESAVAWRLWPTQDGLYPGSNTEVPPDPSDIHETLPRLVCGFQTQIRMFGTGTEQTLDGKPQCEVVYLNQMTARYILDNKLYLRRNLITAAKSAAGIHLPQQGTQVAREIKTEWRVIEPAQFARYVVAIDNSSPPQAYGLVAIHLMSHERPNWLWASWIHEDYKTYMPQGFALHDSYGVNAGGAMSVDLRGLLKARHTPFLEHYKLIGTQTDYEKPTLLGNPLIEGNHLEHSSCMGCHAYASIFADGTWPLPQASKLVGPVTLPEGRKPADFDYSLVGRAKCHGERGCRDSL